MLGLFSFLHKFDHSFLVRYDSAFGFWGDQTFETVLERVQVWIDFLLKKWVDYIIVPPMIELALLQEWVTSKRERGDIILPLFLTYVQEYCFAYSLVGKIWLVGDFADVQIAQKLFEQLEKNYKLTSHQQAIIKFQFPFAYWVKEVGLRKYLLIKFSPSFFLINRTVKFDLRYFKDANIDTLIPLNYSYFRVQKTIGNFFNFNKTRFHKMDKLEACWKKLCEMEKWWKCELTMYGVKIFFTGHAEFLKRDKKWMWLLQRGESIEIWFELV